MLEWVLEPQSYDVVPLDTTAVSDSELEERLDSFLAESPLASTRAVLAGVEGNDKRLSQMLKESPKYDCVERGQARLWVLSDKTAAEGAEQ
jgi:hypothetical protein